MKNVSRRQWSQIVWWLHIRISIELLRRFRSPFEETRPALLLCVSLLVESLLVSWISRQNMSSPSDWLLPLVQHQAKHSDLPRKAVNISQPRCEINRGKDGNTWSPSTGKMQQGIPALKVAPVVPAPPWTTAAMQWGSNHSWGALGMHKKRSRAWAVESSEKTSV